MGCLETASGENGKPLLPGVARKIVLGGARFHIKEIYQQVFCEKVEDVKEFFFIIGEKVLVSSVERIEKAITN